MGSRTRLLVVLGTSAAFGLVVTPPATAASAAARPPFVVGHPFEILPPDAADDDFGAFGALMDVDGDTMVVGAPNDDDPQAGINAGSAYVYVRDGDQWVEQAHLLPSGLGDYDYFGNAVAVMGDTVAVSHAGSVVLFERSADVWTEREKLYPQFPNSGGFGSDLDFSDGTLAVGVQWRDVSGVKAAGAVDIYARSGATWALQGQIVTPGASESYAGFGAALEIQDHTLVVGAPAMSTSRGKDAGVAYVFERTGSTWTPTGKLPSAKSEWDASFGAAVALDGDTIVVGEGDARDTARTHANVYVRTGQGWKQQASITGPVAGDRFGGSVDVQGDTAVVGASYADNAEYQEGVVHLYTRAAGAWTERAILTKAAPQGQDRFGTEVVLTDDLLAVGSYAVADDEKVLVYDR